MAKYIVRKKKLKEARFEKAIEALTSGAETSSEDKARLFELIQQVADTGSQQIKDFWNSIIGVAPVIQQWGDVAVGEFVKTALFPDDLFIKIQDSADVGNEAANESLGIRIRGLELIKAPNSLSVTVLPDVVVNITDIS